MPAGGVIVFLPSQPDRGAPVAGGFAWHTGKIAAAQLLFDYVSAHFSCFLGWLKMLSVKMLSGSRLC
jgi:hypothetical protein